MAAYRSTVSTASPAVKPGEVARMATFPGRASERTTATALPCYAFF